MSEWMGHEDSIFKVTRRLATLLRFASLPPLVLGGLGLILVAGDMAHEGLGRGTWLGAGFFLAIIGLGVLHLVVAWKVARLRRWAMQVAMTLAGCWAAFAGVFGAMAILSEWALLVFAVLIGWASVYGIRQCRLSLKCLNEDDGWSTDEPARPKGFEPVLPAVISSTPLPVREPSVPRGRADS